MRDWSKVCSSYEYIVRVERIYGYPICKDYQQQMLWVCVRKCVCVRESVILISSTCAVTLESKRTQ